MAATMHNIRVIVGIIISSHMGIAYHFEHNGQDMLPQKICVYQKSPSSSQPRNLKFSTLDCSKIPGTGS